MKLLTHNMLRSHVTGVTRGFPLVIRVRCRLIYHQVAVSVKCEWLGMISDWLQRCRYFVPIVWMCNGWQLALH